MTQSPDRDGGSARDLNRANGWRLMADHRLMCPITCELTAAKNAAQQLSVLSLDNMREYLAAGAKSGGVWRPRCATARRMAG